MARATCNRSRSSCDESGSTLISLVTEATPGMCWTIRSMSDFLYGWLTAPSSSTLPLSTRKLMSSHKRVIGVHQNLVAHALFQIASVRGALESLLSAAAAPLHHQGRGHQKGSQNPSFHCFFLLPI